MKGYYIYEERYSRESGLFPGVSQKIENQIGVFSKHFRIKEIQLKSKKNRVAKRIPFGSFIYCWDKAFEEAKDADFLYIRKPLIDSGFRVCMRKLKKNNPGIQILVEIATYPYDQEQFGKSLSKMPFFFKEVCTRKRLKDFVDRVVTYTIDDEIFGIPTIKIQNGIDVSKVPVAVPRENVEGTIKLIAVASLQAYHGYERILKGLQNYYMSPLEKEVHFTIVGSGEAEDELKRLTVQYHLENYVIFVGNKSGDELEDHYNHADIALGSFGLYKRGTFSSSALKTREYLAHGFPIISGCMEDIFHQHPSPYYLEFSNDDTPIDIKKVVEFYNRTYEKENASSIRERIRKYAEEYINIDTTLRPVLCYLRNDLC